MPIAPDFALFVLWYASYLAHFDKLGQMALLIVSSAWADPKVLVAGIEYAGSAGRRWA